jgi:excisionase family DNA binding protein
MAESQRPLTLDEAAAYLNVSVRFMRRLVAERRVAYHKLGALLRFRREDLDGFFAKGRVEPPGGLVRARATRSKMTRRMHAG